MPSGATGRMAHLASRAGTGNGGGEGIVPILPPGPHFPAPAIALAPRKYRLQPHVSHVHQLPLGHPP